MIHLSVDFDYKDDSKFETITKDYKPLHFFRYNYENAYLEPKEFTNDLTNPNTSNTKSPSSSSSSLAYSQNSSQQYSSGTNSSSVLNDSSKASPVYQNANQSSEYINATTRRLIARSTSEFTQLSDLKIQSLADISHNSNKLNNQSVSSTYQMNRLSKAKSFYVKNVQKRASSKYGSTVSLANLKRKKAGSLSSSRIGSEHDSEERSILIDNDDEESLENSDEHESYGSCSNFNQVFLEDVQKKEANDKSVELKELSAKANFSHQDELIRIHPALVSRSSMDIVHEQKRKVENFCVSIESIEQTTRLNTYFNSQAQINDELPHIYDQLNYAKLDLLSNAPAFASQKQTSINKYSKNKSTSTSSLKSSKSSLKKASTHVKCCAKNQQKKRPVSPPPPVFISANGLLAPPPSIKKNVQQLRVITSNVKPVKCSISIDLDDQDDPRHVGLGKQRFNELRILFEKKSNDKSVEDVTNPNVFERKPYDRLNYMLLRAK